MNYKPFRGFRSDTTYVRLPFSSEEKRINALISLAYGGQSALYNALTNKSKDSVKIYIEALLQTDLPENVKKAVLFDKDFDIMSKTDKTLLVQFAKEVIKDPQEISWATVNWIGLANLPVTGPIPDTVAELIYKYEGRNGSANDFLSHLDKTFEEYVSEGLMHAFNDILIRTKIRQDIAIAQKAELISSIFTQKAVNSIGASYNAGLFNHNGKHTAIAQEMCGKTFGEGEETPYQYLKRIYVERLESSSTKIAIAIEGLWIQAKMSIPTPTRLVGTRRNSEPNVQPVAIPSEGRARSASLATAFLDQSQEGSLEEYHNRI